ncbi:hypothetical protein NIES4106_56540 (plasmid) [Fischerella sp. NIES-4106]|nr:hypothetical protein NIES4106_56540 [Fischerella sp. NIES-4106]
MLPIVYRTNYGSNKTILEIKKIIHAQDYCAFKRVLKHLTKLL